MPIANSTNDLVLANRAYYWTAAAVQRLNTGEGSVEGILSALEDVQDTVDTQSYSVLINLYMSVVMGTQQRM